MRKIPNKLKQELLNDEYYTKCARQELFHDHLCEGRITWEHAIIYKGRQLNEKWAIIPLCEKAHSVNRFQDCGILNKEMNVYIALRRSSEKELMDISKVIDYKAKLKYLDDKYRIKG